MAERVHMGADLADLGGEEFVVPHGPAASALRPTCRPARHAKAEDPARRKRNAGIVFVAEPYDLRSLHQRKRLLHLGRTQQVGVATLVIATPARRVPVPAK